LSATYPGFSINSLDALKQLQHDVASNCRCRCQYRKHKKIHQHHLCRYCKHTEKTLKQQYKHSGSSEQEVVYRLAYEVCFEGLPMQAVMEGWWLHASLRDEGHHTRLKKIYEASQKHQLWWLPYNWETNVPWWRRIM
jgi:hypothetical protein